MRFGAIKPVVLALGVAAAGIGAADALAAPSARQDGLCDVLQLVGLAECIDGPAPAPPTNSTPPAPPTSPPTTTTQPPPPAQAAQTESVRHTSLDPQYDPRRIGVVFKAGTTARAIHAAFSRAGVTQQLAVPSIRAYMVGVEPERRSTALASLWRETSVAYAQQEVFVEALDTTPNDSDWSEQWGLRLAGFPQAWDQSQGSARVIVAVVDSGVDSKQPDLHGSLVPGYDFANSDADPRDDFGHGTPVAGIIAARGDNRQGIAGICWSCSVMPVKVLNSDGIADVTVVAAGIVWAVDHGARVINLSLGGAGTTHTLDDAVAYASAHGVVVVAAAGNEGTRTPFYPAASAGALSVAATTQLDRRYSWSNFGTWVALAAPGCNYAPALGGGYGAFCGTSAATPVVAGLAALAFAVNPAATGEEVKQALERAAVPLAGLAQYGRIDAPATLSLMGAATPASARRVTGVIRGVVGGKVESKRYLRRVGAGELSATLTFKGAAPISLSLVMEERAQPVRLRGKSPLRFSSMVVGGTVGFIVASTARTAKPFTLKLAYVARSPG